MARTPRTARGYIMGARPGSTHTVYNGRGEKVRVTVPAAEIPAEELDPRYTFQGTRAALLVELATGRVSAQALAIDELANRGLHPATGLWVGFAMARKVADGLKDQEGIL